MQRQIIVNGTIGGRTGRVIQSIKSLRACSGLGLKEAKQIIDDGNSGAPTKLVVDLDALKRDPSAAELAYEIVAPTSLQGFVGHLRAFEATYPGMSLIGLIRVLETTAQEFSA